jgi:hypothetical protein
MTVGLDESVTVPLDSETVPVTMYVPVVNTCTTPEEALMTVGLLLRVTTPLDTDTVPVTT